MHTDDGDQVGAFTLVEVFQVRQGLEVVGVQTLLGHLHVRLHVVGEDFDFQVHAFFGQGRLDQFKDLGMRDRGSGYHQFLVGLGEACSQGSRQCGKQQNLFHAVSLSKIRVVWDGRFFSGCQRSAIAAWSGQYRGFLFQNNTFYSL